MNYKERLQIAETKIKKATERFKKLRTKFCISTNQDARKFVDEAIQELESET